MSVNRTHVEDKMRRFKGECAQFSFNRFPTYTHDGASAKFSTNSQEMDNSADTHVFGHPGSGSISQKYGFESVFGFGSFPFLIKVLRGLK